PGRVALRRPRVVGVVLQRRGRGALLPAGLLRFPAVARVRGTALQRGEAGLPVPALRDAGHGRVGGPLKSVTSTSPGTPGTACWAKRVRTSGSCPATRCVFGCFASCAMVS